MHKNKLIWAIFAAIVALVCFIVHFTGEDPVFSKAKWLIGGFVLVIISGVYLWRAIDIITMAEVQKSVPHIIPLDKLVVSGAGIDIGIFLMTLSNNKYYFGELAESQLNIVMKIKKDLDDKFSLENICERLNDNKCGFSIECTKVSVSNREVIFRFNYKRLKR